MGDDNSPKLGLRQGIRGDLQQKLIMTPKIRRYISEEEDKARLFLPPKKG